MKNSNIRFICEIAILAAMIGITGAIKIPNVIPGIEFQLSAPLAVAICCVFGFKRYIIAGCLASAISLMLGTHNLLNVAIQMQFRVIAGAVLYLGHRAVWSQVIAGPIASIIARLTLGLFFGKLAMAMILMAVPGYIFTAIFSPLLVKVLSRVRRSVPALSGGDKANAL